jgi:hypothetical protein
MVVVYLYKQDVESFYLGTYAQNAVTQVKTVALSNGASWAHVA